MPLTIPPARNYQSPLTAVPSLMQDEPEEGRKQIAAEILWGTMVPSFAVSGVIPAMFLNLQDNAPLEFRQVSGLKVDNSKCGADIEFIFPDSGETISIPAYAPITVVPVFSNGKQFYVVAPNGVTGDVTRFIILNYRQFPLSVPVASGQNVAALAGGQAPIPIAANTTDYLIPASVKSGTITDINISVSWAGNTTVSGDVSGTILDGAGNSLVTADVRVANPSSFTGLLVNLSNVELHFENPGAQGVGFFQYGTNVIPPGGAWMINMLYRSN